MNLSFALYLMYLYWDQFVEGKPNVSQENQIKRKIEIASCEKALKFTYSNILDVFIEHKIGITGNVKVKLFSLDEA